MELVRDVFLVFVAAGAFYFTVRALIVVHFRHKEELVDKIQAKAKGHLDGTGS